MTFHPLREIHSQSQDMEEGKEKVHANESQARCACLDPLSHQKKLGWNGRLWISTAKGITVRCRVEHPSRLVPFAYIVLGSICLILLQAQKNR